MKLFYLASSVAFLVLAMASYFEAYAILPGDHPAAIKLLYVSLGSLVGGFWTTMECLIGRE